MHSHTESVPHLAPRPSPPWRWLCLLTQIQQVTLGQWAVNELVLITVNSTASDRVFRRACLHACIHVVKPDRLKSWKREVHSSASGSNQECLIARADHLRLGSLGALTLHHRRSDCCLLLAVI